MTRRRRSGSLRGWSLALVLVACGWWASEAQAQDGEPLKLQLEHFEPMADPRTNILNVVGSGVSPHLKPVVGFTLHLAHDPLTFSPAEGNRGPQRLVRDQLKGELGFAIGFFDLLGIEAVLPMILDQQGGSTDLAAVGRPGVVVEGFQLMDARLTPKVTMMDSRYVGGVGLAVAFPIYLPLGDEAQLNSEGLRIEPRLAADWSHDSGVVLGANLGYRLRRWGLSARSPVGVEGLSAQAVFFGNFPVGQSLLGALVSPNQSFATNPVELLGGLQYEAPWDMTFGLHGGGALAGGMGAANLRAVATIAWTPRPPQDLDLDGNIDETDLCPDEEEDFDGFADFDGCPDPDNDGDGISDEDDKCMYEAEDPDGYADGDGCPDIDSHEPDYKPDYITTSMTLNAASPTADLAGANGGPPTRARPPSSPYRLYAVEGAKVLGHLDTAAEVQVEPVRHPDRDGPIQDQGALRSNQLFAIGAADWYEFGLDFPLFASTGETALGDPRLSAKVMTIDPDNSPIGFALSLPVTVPLQDSAFSRRAVEAGPTAILEVDTSPLRTRLNLGASLLQNIDDLDRPIDGALRYGVGGEFSLIERRLKVGAEIAGERSFQSLLRSQDDASFAFVLGVSYHSTESFAMTLGGHFGLAPEQVLPELAVFGTLTYTTVISDVDNDGISDDADRCPVDPEDHDQFEDIDGCPELDNDQDGINDQRDVCPLDPEDLDQVFDEDGCPEEDGDGDKIPDEQDKCPTVKGSLKLEGCPGNDPDDDGVFEDDQCPDEPEDRDGFKDEDGCPELDNDGDEVPDEEDDCPNVAGVRQWKGCDDVVVSVLFDVQRARITRDSFKALDEMAEIIATNDVFSMVEIQGHTDDVGSLANNMKLSQERANAVRDYLVDKGVNPGRIVARGYGEEVPAVKTTGITDPTELKEARRRNRRVVFKLIR